MRGRAQNSALPGCLSQFQFGFGASGVVVEPDHQFEVRMQFVLTLPAEGQTGGPITAFLLVATLPPTFGTWLPEATLWLGGGYPVKSLFVSRFRTFGPCR